MRSTFAFGGVILPLLLFTFAFSQDPSSGVKRFYDMLLFSKGKCLEVVRDTLGVRLARDLYAPVSEEQVKLFCKNLGKVRRSFPQAVKVEVEKPRPVPRKKGVYVRVRLKHVKGEDTLVDQFVVETPKGWRLIF